MIDADCFGNRINERMKQAFFGAWFCSRFGSGFLGANCRAKLPRADARLEVGEQAGIVDGKRGGRFAILLADFRQTCGCRFSFRYTNFLPVMLLATILNGLLKRRAKMPNFVGVEKFFANMIFKTPGAVAHSGCKQYSPRRILKAKLPEPGGGSRWSSPA